MMLTGLSCVELTELSSKIPIKEIMSPEFSNPVQAQLSSAYVGKYLTKLPFFVYESSHKRRRSVCNALFKLCKTAALVRGKMPKGGHVRLTGKEADEKDEVFAGRIYQVRYLGASDNKAGKGKGCTNEAVREIYSRYNTKNAVKCLARRELFVSANCVSLYAPIEQAVIFRFLTKNITFCNTSDENHNAFAFVVREDAQPSQFRAHVIHCDNPSQANAICMAMYQAFAVGSALYQAKRIERAGWTNSLFASQEQDVEITRQPEQNAEESMENIHENGTPNEADSNNNFGDFSCAVVLPCKKDSCSELGNNNNVNNPSKARYPERTLEVDNGYNSLGSPCVEKEAFAQNGAGFSWPKLLLQGKKNRGRSQSLPFEMLNPWGSTNGEWGCFQSSKNGGIEEDDFDAFSMFARERSSSMNLLAAEMR